nr:ATP synthase F0 subunit 8 [Cardiastethus sp.]
MPQMAPMWWTALFMMFTLCFVLVIIIMYSSINFSPVNIDTKTTINKLIWKW